MLLHRKVLLAVTVVVAGGSFYATLGYGVYLHSDYYRTMKERDLARFLELPASIGEVKPQNYYQADFLDICVWLPGRRGEVFHCNRAEVHELPGQGGAFNLTIRDGRVTVDASQWHESDYRQVLRSGLGHDFAALKLRRVDLFDVDWPGGTVRSPSPSETPPASSSSTAPTRTVPPAKGASPSSARRLTTRTPTSTSM